LLKIFAIPVTLEEKFRLRYKDKYISSFHKSRIVLCSLHLALGFLTRYRYKIAHFVPIKLNFHYNAKTIVASPKDILSDNVCTAITHIIYIIKSLKIRKHIDSNLNNNMFLFFFQKKTLCKIKQNK